MMVSGIFYLFFFYSLTRMCMYNIRSDLAGGSPPPTDGDGFRTAVFFFRSFRKRRLAVRLHSTHRSRPVPKKNYYQQYLKKKKNPKALYFFSPGWLIEVPGQIRGPPKRGKNIQNPTTTKKKTQHLAVHAHGWVGRNIRRFGHSRRNIGGRINII